MKIITDAIRDYLNKKNQVENSIESRVDKLITQIEEMEILIERAMDNLGDVERLKSYDVLITKTENYHLLLWLKPSNKDAMFRIARINYLGTPDADECFTTKINYCKEHKKNNSLLEYEKLFKKATIEKVAKKIVKFFANLD